MLRSGCCERLPVASFSSPHLLIPRALDMCCKAVHVQVVEFSRSCKLDTVTADDSSQQLRASFLLVQAGTGDELPWPYNRETASMSTVVSPIENNNRNNDSLYVLQYKGSNSRNTYLFSRGDTSASSKNET